MQNGNYILVTPAKNEEKNLSNLINSVLELTINPILWVIVDDGSEDNTPDIIRDVKSEHNWIHSIHLEEHQRDTGKHLAYVCNVGFDFAVKYCKNCNIQYEYLGIVDADMILEKEFFDKLIREFKDNPKLGIASGSEYYYNSNNELTLEKVRDELPMGCMRLWRKECFDETGGGYYISSFPDSVSNASAKIKGWETKIFYHIKSVQARKMHSAEGLWKGYIIAGASDYFRNYHPFFVVIKGLKYLCKNPHYIGIAYIYGYFNSFLRRADKIDNEEIKDYYRNKHKEVVQFYWTKLKNKLTRDKNEKL